MTNQLWAQEKLREYCGKNNIDFFKFIKTNKLETLFCHAIPELEYTEDIDERLYSQSKRYYAFHQCMYELKSICEKHNTKYAFLKGMALAKDIYYPVESRKSKDIDILVEKRNVREILVEMSNYGYRNREGNQFDIKELVKHCQNGHHHVDPVYKRINIGDAEITVCVEVHVFPFEKSFELYGKTEYNDLYATKLLNRTETFDIGGCVVSRPCLCDLAFILIMHLCTHLFLDLSLYCYVNKPFRRYNIISLTMDIAMFARKHRNKMNWDEVMSVAKENGVLPAAIVCIEIINQMYGGVIKFTPAEYEALSSPINCLSSIVGKIGIEKYLFSDEYELHLREYIVENIVVGKRRDTDHDSINLECKGDDNLDIVLSNPQNGYTSIVLYSRDATKGPLAMEIVLHVDAERITAYIGNDYKLIWGEDTWGQLNENELIKAYGTVNCSVYSAGTQKVVTIEDKNLNKFLSANQCIIEVVSLENPNPFISKLLR